MSESAHPTPEHYRETAEEIRQVAARVSSDEIRDELLLLAERYERLAARAAQLRCCAIRLVGSRIHTENAAPVGMRNLA